MKQIKEKELISIKLGNAIQCNWKSSIASSNLRRVDVSNRLEMDDFKWVGWEWMNYGDVMMRVSQSGQGEGGGGGGGGGGGRLMELLLEFTWGEQVRHSLVSGGCDGTVCRCGMRMADGRKKRMTLVVGVGSTGVPPHQRTTQPPLHHPVLVAHLQVGFRRYLRFIPFHSVSFRFIPFGFIHLGFFLFCFSI